MSLKSRNTNYKVILDTPSLRRATADQNNLLAYTLLTFVVVIGLYFLTSDWKGFTAPEEIDLGSVRIHRGRNRYKPDRARD